MPDRYSVTRMKWGILVVGQLPVSDLVVLAEAWRELGYTILDTAISGKLHATFAVTNEEGSEAWRQELGLNALSGEPEETEKTEKRPSGGRRRVGGYPVYEDGERCAGCGAVQLQTQEDKDAGAPAGYYLECPRCYRPGCEECMPAGRGCLCPVCEDGGDDDGTE